MILVAVGCWLLLNRHKLGAHIYLIGDNEASARLMGVNVRRTRVLTFVLVGLASAFAGVLATFQADYSAARPLLTEALELCREAKPDAVVLDVKLPGIDGIETLKRIKGLVRQKGFMGNLTTIIEIDNQPTVVMGNSGTQRARRRWQTGVARIG